MLLEIFFYEINNIVLTVFALEINASRAYVER